MRSRRPSTIGSLGTGTLRKIPEPASGNKKERTLAIGPKGITLSDQAIEKILSLTAEDAQTEKGLRVKVVGGGCSGLSYKMDLDEERKGDRVFERDGARIIVDRKSYLYLNGTELDYSDDLMQSGFQLNNPNVSRTCGCGQSFGI
ncbi:MAG TPA: iron-sulfur cluster assembly accessory protein [Deltaproteobacteria bacterium]|nr:iron-sulfur cluster assembly accessory protein [Deltaproteobacteria bacterium]